MYFDSIVRLAGAGSAGPVPETDLAIMRYPFAGSRMLRGPLAAEGARSVGAM